MYEIWLAMNILWELALMNLPLVLAYLALLVALLALAIYLRPLPWRKSCVTALLAGLAVLIISFLLAPGLTDSSFAELTYWVDWANLLAVATGFGTAASILAWPAGALLKKRTHNTRPD